MGIRQQGASHLLVCSRHLNVSKSAPQAQFPATTIQSLGHPVNVQRVPEPCARVMRFARGRTSVSSDVETGRERGLEVVVSYYAL